MQNLFAHAERIENSKITTIIPAETETCKILKVKTTFIIIIKLITLFNHF